MRCEELYRLLNIYWQQDDRDIATEPMTAPEAESDQPSDPRLVFVIHGRDEEARRALFTMPVSGLQR